MSSRRFPGKVLAPYRGRPVVRHVLAAVEETFGPGVPITVLTSVETSDDPLAAYLGHFGIDVFRGPLADVFSRFQQCLDARPCTWILRLNCDSPLLSPTVLRLVVEKGLGEICDLVTTTFPRSFPKGQNAELIRSDVFRRLPDRELDECDREHVTRFYYRHADRFRIVNVESPHHSCGGHSLAVDTIDDLERLERLSDSELLAIGCGSQLRAGDVC
jgi:spore coat polysaccharide biosynthesis protein SpsF